MAFDEFDVGGTGSHGVGPGEVEHLVGHVQAEGAAGEPDAACRQQHVDATAGTQIENSLALLEFCHGDGVAAAKTGQHRIER